MCVMVLSLPSRSTDTTPALLNVLFTQSVPGQTRALLVESIKQNNGAALHYTLSKKKRRKKEKATEGLWRIEKMHGDKAGLASNGGRQLMSMRLTFAHGMITLSRIPRYYILGYRSHQAA